MTFCRRTIWLLVAVAALLPAGCASQRGRMASKHDVNTAQLLAAARQYEKEGNLQSAANVYRHVLQFHPGNTEAREGLALVQQGKLRVDYDPQQFLASSDPSSQPNPQARRQPVRSPNDQRQQVSERMAELIAQAAENPTKIEVNPTPAQFVIASSEAKPLRPNVEPTPDSAATQAPMSPALITQVTAAVEKTEAAKVETTQFQNSAKEEVPADWKNGGWKGHSLTDKCLDASAAVLTQVRKLESNADADRKEGLTALAQLGPEAISAAPAVRQLLGDQNQLVRAHAAWALWEIEGDAEIAVDVLQKSLTSKSTHVVQFASYALGNLGEFARPAAPTLGMLLSDEDAYVRLHAAEALTRVCDGEDATNAMDTLVLLLKDADAGVRALAATTLAEADGDDAAIAIAALTEALGDDDAGVRSAAALSLGAFGSAAQSAAAKLEQAVANDQTNVREAATTALTCIKL
jgi:hypothetical protein